MSKKKNKNGGSNVADSAAYDSVELAVMVTDSPKKDMYDDFSVNEMMLHDACVVDEDDGEEIGSLY